MSPLRTLCLVLLGLFALPKTASAIPAFARKYETSCQTCHLAFPKLTPFGEAFRQNGLRFPDGGDEVAQKQEPVSLGNEAQADRWPKIVFPGKIPADFPASLVLSGALGLGTEFETHAHGAEEMTMEMVHGGEEETTPTSEDLMLDASTLVDMFGVRVAGTLGDHVSVLGAVNLGGHALVEVERANVIFAPFSPTDLRIKVGAFEPELHGISIHRGLVGHMLRLTTRTVGDSPWSPEPTQYGVELSGVAAHRVGWVLGGVENATPDTYLAKDVYGRAFVKLGGMPTDGSGNVSGTAPWRERSVILGASAWNGRALVSTDTTAQDNPFTRVGVDVHVVFDNLLVDLVAAEQWDESPYAGDVQDTQTEIGFAEVTYVVTPVVFPTARLEIQQTHEPGVQGNPEWLGLGVVNGVVRPNVLLRAAVGFGADVEETPHFRFVTLNYAVAL